MGEMWNTAMLTIAGFFLLFLVTPAFIFIVVKSAVYAFYLGKRKFERDHLKKGSNGHGT